MIIDLYNADALDILPTLAPVQLIINDPPYFHVVKDDWDHQWKTKDDYLEWVRQWLQLEIPLVLPTGSLYIWGSVGERSDTILHIKLLADRLGLYFKDWITWSKSRGMGNRKGWMYTREELLWYVRDNRQFTWNTEHQYSTERRKRDGGKNVIRVSQNGHKAKSLFKRYTNVWTDISENSYDVMSKKGHSTPKPKRAIERIILAHTTVGDTVLDPFLGSGTTCEVAKVLGRNCIGIEKDPTIFEETVKRLYG